VLGEPIGSSLITWIAFGEQPPAHAALGGAVVLAGIAIGFVRRQAAAPPDASLEASATSGTPRMQ
jgi:drug/metabolite transporter (DMT)-like permease